MQPFMIGTLLLLFARSAVAQPSPAQSHIEALAHFRTGMVALESERYEEAEAEFQRAIRLEADFAFGEGCFVIEIRLGWRRDQGRGRRD